MTPIDADRARESFLHRKLVQAIRTDNRTHFGLHLMAGSFLEQRFQQVALDIHINDADDHRLRLAEPLDAVNRLDKVIKF